MDRCVLLTWTPECVVSPCRAITRAQVEWSPGGETTHKVADVNDGMPIDFKAVQCISVESGKPCHDNISWYIQFN